MNERTADLTQNFYLPRGAAAGDTVDSVSVFEQLTVNDPELTALRASVRDFLRNDRAEFGWQPTVDAWLSRWDEAFSARLGDAGFLGLTRHCGESPVGHRHTVTRTRGTPALRHNLGCGARGCVVERCRRQLHLSLRHDVSRTVSTRV
jgi:hypothetical protein